MQLDDKNAQDDLRPYRIGPFTILQFMALLALLGLAITWGSRFFN